MSRVMKAVPLVVFCALIIAVPSVWANWVQDGVALCTATGEQYLPTITSDGAGGAIVTWYDKRSGSNYDIYVQRVNASGAVLWTPDGVALCTATGDQVYPQITSDGAGGAIVAWQDTGSVNWKVYAQRVDALGAAQWATDGVALCAATGDQQSPQIISDGAGGATVTWYDNRTGNADVYAQGLNASGAIQWPTDGVALCTATGDQSYPTITSDGAGGAIVTWQDNRSGSYADIYAQSVNASGAVQWAANGVAICTAMGWQQYPRITSDGAGGAIVTWQDNPSGSDYDIFAQRVNASGAVQWTANGVGLCSATGFQLDPRIISDGESGAIVTWMDNRSGDPFDPKLDIYVQRVSASGTVLWKTDGVALSTAPGNGAYPMITSDGAGGAIVTWYGGPSGSWDIYAQRVNAWGAIQWTANGVALSTAAGAQMQPQITSDGAGGAIVVWYDYRNGGHPDIYGLRVDANGFAPLTATDASAVPLQLHQNYPNPFNPATTVTYSIPEKFNVTLKIYDVSGKCVACLVDWQQEKGSYAVEWSGKDEKGNSVASGIYFCRLAAGSRTIVRKMVLLR